MSDEKRPVSTSVKQALQQAQQKKTDTNLHTLQSGPFDVLGPEPEKVEAIQEVASDLREPMRPPAQGMRPWQERHRLRAPEEYPMESMEGSRFHITRPTRRNDGSITSWGEYPEGFDLQWVGISIWGQHQPQIEAEFTRKGWEPVHTGDFDGKYDGRFLPRSHVGPMISDGLMLVARPMAWSDKARGLANRDAYNRVAIKVGQLRAGELEGVSGAQHKHLEKTNFVNVDVETVSAPKTSDK